MSGARRRHRPAANRGQERPRPPSNGSRASPNQAVHDGDTVSISPNSFLNTRLLGIDMPEISFSLPGERTFPSIGGDRWKAFLSDPFAPTLPSFSPALPGALRAHLDAAVGPGCAENHHALARAAEAKFQDLVEADIAATGIPADQFGLFSLSHMRSSTATDGSSPSSIATTQRPNRAPTTNNCSQPASPRPTSSGPTLPPSFVIAVSPNQAFRSEASTSKRPVTPSRPPGKTS